MTYASLGRIEASDFNNLLGAAAGTTGGGNQFNPVWATGYGSYGYGQTALSNVTIGTSVLATSWAGLINNLNSATRHQTGSATALTAPTVGTRITYLSTLTSGITTAATNRTTVAATTTSTSNKNMTLNASGGVATSGSTSWSVTFASVDQARYFFNAGGSIMISCVGFTNNDATSRSSSIGTLAQTNFVSKTLRATSWTARTGAGGTASTDVTADGFYGVATSSTTYLNINSSSYYTGDYFRITAYTAGGAGSYGGNGDTVYLTATAYSAADSDTINCTVNMRLTVYYPDTTYITNSWGTPTIA